MTHQQKQAARQYARAQPDARLARLADECRATLVEPDAETRYTAAQYHPKQNHEITHAEAMQGPEHAKESQVATTSFNFTTLTAPKPCPQCGAAPSVAGLPYRWVTIGCDTCYDGAPDSKSVCITAPTVERAIRDWNEYCDEYRDDHEPPLVTVGDDKPRAMKSVHTLNWCCILFAGLVLWLVALAIYRASF